MMSPGTTNDPSLRGPLRLLTADFETWTSGGPVGGAADATWAPIIPAATRKLAIVATASHEWKTALARTFMPTPFPCSYLVAALVPHRPGPRARPVNEARSV